MRRCGRMLGLAGILLIGAACGMGVLLHLAPPLAWQDQDARARWVAQGVRHYRADISWADGWQVGAARVEVRDQQLLAAVDLRSGAPLVAAQYSSAGYFASVEKLFTLVETRIAATMDWRRRLGLLHPLLARWFKPCVVPLGRVHYDPSYGYPTLIEYNDGGCGAEFFTYSKVTMTNFTPLP
jgi:hypothetical protein